MSLWIKASAKYLTFNVVGDDQQAAAGTSCIDTPLIKALFTRSLVCLNLERNVSGSTFRLHEQDGSAH